MVEENPFPLEYASSIESVDTAMYNWLSGLNLFCNTNSGWKRTPVIWVAPERAFMVKHERELADGTGAIIPPFISLERTAISRETSKNGVFYANIPPKDTEFMLSRRVNQERTSKFINAYAKKTSGSGFSRPTKIKNKVVYEYKSMRMPTYANFTYTISIMAQYQQQMNELVQPFLTLFGSNRYFVVKEKSYTYECFLAQEVGLTNNVASMEGEERKYVSKLTINTLAKLISAGANEDKPIFRVYENPVELLLNEDKTKVSAAITAAGFGAQGGSDGGNSGAGVINQQPFSVFNNKAKRRFYITPDSANTDNELTTLVHNLGSDISEVTISEAEDLESEIVTGIYYFTNYILIQNLAPGTTYLVIISV